MTWKVIFHEDFEEEVLEMKREVRVALVSSARLLEEFGPDLKRPHADTLKGSKYANMKELRFRVNKAVWRVAYAFDPRRQAILLAAGMKQGRNEQRFYERLIALADRRYADHLDKSGKG